MSTQPPPKPPVAPTGSGGATGTTGQPAGPGTGGPLGQPAYTPPKQKAKVWNETPQGVKLEGGYDAFKGTFQHHIPNASNQLKALARRPIGG